LLQEEFWVLNQLDELALVYDEIKTYLPSFMELYRSLKRNRMLNENHMLQFLRHAGHDLPSLEDKFHALSSDVIDLQWKRKQYGNEVAMLGSTIYQLRNSVNGLQMVIELKKQLAAD
jgi:hypothetical protein